MLSNFGWIIRRRMGSDEQANTRFSRQQMDQWAIIQVTARPALGMGTTERWRARKHRQHFWTTQKGIVTTAPDHAPDPSPENRLRPPYPHTRHPGGSVPGQGQAAGSSHTSSPPDKPVVTPHASPHCQLPQRCPEIDGYAIEGARRAFVALPLACDRCSPSRSPESNDDAVQATSEDGEWRVGEPLVGSHRHPSP